MTSTSSMPIAMATPRNKTPSPTTWSLGGNPPSASRHAATNSIVFQSAAIGHCDDDNDNNEGQRGPLSESG